MKQRDYQYLPIRDVNRLVEEVITVDPKTGERDVTYKTLRYVSADFVEDDEDGTSHSEIAHSLACFMSWVSARGFSRACILSYPTGGLGLNRGARRRAKYLSKSADVL